MKKELKILSKIENLSLIEKFIDEISSELILSTEIYGNMLLSVIEGVTNSIIHGNKRDAKKNVKITAETDKNLLQITIEDEGNGFDCGKIPDPTKNGNIEKPDGRGIFLMKHLSDEIEYDKNGTIVKLKFNI